MISNLRHNMLLSCLDEQLDTPLILRLRLISCQCLLKYSRKDDHIVPTSRRPVRLGMIKMRRRAVISQLLADLAPFLGMNNALGRKHENKSHVY